VTQEETDATVRWKLYAGLLRVSVELSGNDDLLRDRHREQLKEPLVSEMIDRLIAGERFEQELLGSDRGLRRTDSPAA
jgi:hypothetical protein